ncbi:hypothetical protein QFW77_01795 [Luteimonas sp. RD2P54]|uniref:Uncharacterized protein n=1 Tax=Luteimonas endophytica TaxID=3042023 RepID=A0ABT6J6C1_9GAMM|nr:hypothetical protein [Luteimonas endophytica]MDH5821728.1 hypothetical protein [Luteimonas endophytica]
MTMRRRVPALLALASLGFAAAHLAYEHFSGGVQSHHLLNNPDLPAVSNWLGLIALPLLGWMLGVRIRNHLASSTRPGMSAGMWPGLAGGLLYGAAMAVSFELDASAVTSGLFIGLLLFAVALPVYRAEYVFGFIVGMTFTFGAVLPSLVAAVLAAVSVVVRLVFRGVAAVVRPSTRSRAAT